MKSKQAINFIFNWTKYTINTLMKIHKDKSKFWKLNLNHRKINKNKIKVFKIIMRSQINYLKIFSKFSNMLNLNNLKKLIMKNSY